MGREKVEGIGGGSSQQRVFGASDQTRSDSFVCIQIQQSCFDSQMFGATEEPEPHSITLTTSSAALGKMTFDLRVPALPPMAAAGSWKHFRWSEVNYSVAPRTQSDWSHWFP